MRPLNVVVILLAIVGLCRAQDVARMDTVIQSYVRRGDFWGAVLVARGSEVMLNKGYGLANAEWELPNSPSTRFRLGSLTKQFTAAAILLLEERGKLSVNATVKTYLPDAPAAWDDITLTHLLAHTSGLPDYTRFKELAPFRLALTPQQLVATFRDKPLEFEPGSDWRYSNSGYVLLGFLIERLSGENYATFLRKNIFEPLAMKDTGYDSTSDILRQRASGYERVPGGVRNAAYLDMSTPFAAGGLSSTTEDMLRWENGLLHGSFLSAASRDKMLTPLRNNYAFGVGVTTTKAGRRQIAHSGGINGFFARLVHYPDGQWTIIVLGNVSNRYPVVIADALADVVHGKPVILPEERKAKSVPRPVLERYVGRYGTDPGPSYTIAIAGDCLTTQADGQPAIRLFAESETRFFLPDIDIVIEFISESDGKATRLVVYENAGNRSIPRKRS